MSGSEDFVVVPIGNHLHPGAVPASQEHLPQMKTGLA